MWYKDISPLWYSLFFTACPTDATVDPTSQKCTCPTAKPGLNDAGDACIGNGTN